MGDWRKSSHSGGEGGACLEAAAGDHAILIRDTTDRAGATLSVPAAAWQAFTSSLK